MNKPIAWLNPDPDYEQICPEIGFEATICEQHPRDLGWIPLYAQREWVGLTDEEVDDAAHYCVKSGQSVNAAIRAIEQALKDKNT
jgi:hypothetical protein